MLAARPKKKKKKEQVTLSKLTKRTATDRLVVDAHTNLIASFTLCLPHHIVATVALHEKPRACAYTHTHTHTHVHSKECI